MDRLTALAAVLLLSGACAATSPAPEPPHRVGEISGVARSGDRLLLVGDDDDGVLYEMPLPDVAGPRIRLDEATFTVRRLDTGDTASDLEAVDILADGRVVVLSEDLAALVSEHGVLLRAGDRLAEWGGRGLEGLAVRALPDGSSRVVICWEGGYPSVDGLAPDPQARVAGRAFRPRVVVFDVPAGAREVTLDESSLRELQPPLPEGEEPYAQRFRAPDLVWCRLPGDDEWGFLALLSSQWGAQPPEGSPAACSKQENGRAIRYCYRWLQRFHADGRAFGEPLDLEPFLPESLRFANWEGMGWWDEGESVILVYDESIPRRRLEPPIALVVSLPEGWRHPASPPGGRME